MMLNFWITKYIGNFSELSIINIPMLIGLMHYYINSPTMSLTVSYPLLFFNSDSPLITLIAVIWLMGESFICGNNDYLIVAELL